MPAQTIRETCLAAYVALFLAALAAAQGYALLRQWELGFRPFVSAPQRVPFSWDMFAVEIERCSVSWDPPSAWRGKALRRLSDLGAPIEWDPVYNHRQDYIGAAAFACGIKPPGTSEGPRRFQVDCFVGGAQETHDEFACPVPR